MSSIPIQKRALAFGGVYAVVFLLLGPIGAWPVASKAASSFPESKRWANGLRVTKLLAFLQAALFIHVGYLLYDYVVNFHT